MSTIKSSNEHLTLNADGSGKDIKFQSNGSEVASISDGGVVTATSYAGSGANLTGISSVGGATGVDFNDNVKARFGTGNDLEIYHSGSHSIINETGDGYLVVQTNGTGMLFQKGTTEDMAKFLIDGAVELYHNNVKKFETTADGIKVTDRVTGSGDLVLTTVDSNEKIHMDSDGYIKLEANGSERMRILADGKVGIGEASPTAARLHITTNDQGTLPSLQSDADDVVIENSTPGITLMGATNGGGMLAFGDTDDADVGRIFYYHVNNNMDFITNGDTRLSLRNDGQLISYVPAGASKTNISFYNGGAKKGSIVTSDHTNNTTYNTSSDYRLKENVDYTWDATTRLKQLKPARFNWIADDTNTLFDGFIAHEVSSVVPEAISGAKDAMTEAVLYVEGDELPEGKSVGDVKTASIIDPQGIDQSKLVPLLVKTIQELEARIAALEA